MADSQSGENTVSWLDRDLTLVSQLHGDSEGKQPAFSSFTLGNGLFLTKRHMGGRFPDIEKTFTFWSIKNSGHCSLWVHSQRNSPNHRPVRSQCLASLYTHQVAFSLWAACAGQSLIHFPLDSWNRWDLERAREVFYLGCLCICRVCI